MARPRNPIPARHVELSSTPGMSEAIIRGRGNLILIKGDKLMRFDDAEAEAIASLVTEWKRHREAREQDRSPSS